jgi:hypothetical protein
VGELYRVRLRSLAEDPDAFDQTVTDAEAKGLDPLADLLTAGGGLGTGRHHPRHRRQGRDGTDLAVVDAPTPTTGRWL